MNGLVIVPALIVLTAAVVASVWPLVKPPPSDHDVLQANQLGRRALGEAVNRCKH